MSRNLIVNFILIYIFFITIITSYFLYDYNKTKSSYLNQKTIEHHLLYKAIVEENRNIAELIFNTQINIEKIIDIFKNAYNADEVNKEKIRNSLYNELKYEYNKLKSFNLKQLHFQLPNNDSFLRMHRPNIYGDNLSNVRPTVKYVNENQKEIHGFEEGRIFNGFRYIYPLFDEKKTYIGSVEISFSALSLIEIIHKTYNLNSSFLIKKDIVDKKVFEDEKINYIQSPNKGFYFEKVIYETFPPTPIDTKSEDLTNKILEDKSFSMYLENLKLIKSIIPIKNPITQEVVAALCINIKDSYISILKENLISILLISYILLSLVIYLFYKQQLANIKLKKLNSDLDKKIALEIKKSRKKDISILNNAKMASIAQMLNNIAHQWRQPLNLISTSASGLKIHKEVDTLDDKNFEILTNLILEQSAYLSKTIENFKDYIGDNKNEKIRFSIQSIVDKSLEIVSKTFNYSYITIKKDFNEKELFITANESELIQVILNILNNAKEALKRNNNIENRTITVSIKERSSHFGLITIEDNAGGVPEEIIDKVFDPYFTTKHESIGIGISLYMCYEIVTMNLKGKIYVKNKKEGAKFYIELPLIV